MAEKFTSIKHVVYFMSSDKIRLSRQDTDFITSMYKIFSCQGDVTSNQVGLFKHILGKYDRQFRKYGHDVNQLMRLPWGINIVPSISMYTDAHLFLLDGKIILRSPYNTKFLKYFRGAPGNEFFVWNKIDKRFEATFNTITLKFIIDMAFEHFKTVIVCPIIQCLLDKLSLYDQIPYWDPTLIKVNGQFMIAATNPSVDEVVSKVSLSDDPYTLHYLVKHAINIDSSLLETPIQRFAGDYNPTIEYADIETLIDWLIEIKCDGVYSQNIAGKYRPNLKQLLNTAKLPLHDAGVNTILPKPKDLAYSNPIIIKGLTTKSFFDILPVSKIITLVDNTPIKIK
jgi:hypothetical protein